jgi:hypothetical protein
VSGKSSWPLEGNADSMVPSKSSPPPSTYDEPGKPFDALLKATGCPAGSTAVTCLKAVPSEVYFLFFDSTCALNHSQRLINISNTLITSTLNHQLWEPTIAPGSFAPVRASAKIALGDFVHVPVISGTNVSRRLNDLSRPKLLFKS